MTSAAPIFPQKLDRLAPPGMVVLLTAIELGAFYFLTLAAWEQEPPCSLPDDEAALQNLARVGAGDWQSIAPRVLPAYPFWRDIGRLYNAHARAVYDELRAARSARSQKARKAADGRWIGGLPNADTSDPAGWYAQPGVILRIGPPPPNLPTPSDAPSMLDPCSEHAPSMLQASPPLSPLPSESALKRRTCEASGSSASAPNRTRPASPAPASVIAAGVNDVQQAAEREEIYDLLCHARWGWAEEGRRQLWPDLARRLATSRHATVERAAYAIEAIDSMGVDWQVALNMKRETKRPDPISLVIAIFGAQIQKPKPPWEIPMVFQKRFEEKTGAKRKRAEIQRATNELLRRAPDHKTQAKEIG